VKVIFPVNRIPGKFFNRKNMEEHKKHVSLAKSILGTFGRNEISILGTPCGNIKELAYKLIGELSPEHKISYVDADHKNVALEKKDQISALSFGASMEYTDKIDFQRIDYASPFNEFQIKNHFIDNDLVLINGNHFDAKNQLVVIDPQKPLQKKLNRLNNVIAFILKNSEGIPDYIKEHKADYNEIPIFVWNDFDKILLLVNDFLKKQVPEIKGLILAGGKSSRMKQDKSLLQYHDKSQIEHTFDLLYPFCKETFISIPAEQKDKVPGSLEIIEDAFLHLGPYGAILSAFRKDPQAAWLVIACDLPFLDSEALNHLINNRNPSSIATAFLDSEKQFPEPLITIWEPKSYFKLLYFLGLGYSCPRKVLINTDCHVIEAPNVKALQNVNYPEEYEAVKNNLAQKNCN
ncbi:MAG: NTP transferase domain-containing protein, partial [Bacteroidota bacterium]|nr:NTP transferase domain-containing protein [Bacteroidota bacterium]